MPIRRRRTNFLEQPESLAGASPEVALRGCARNPLGVIRDLAPKGHGKRPLRVQWEARGRTPRAGLTRLVLDPAAAADSRSSLNVGPLPVVDVCHGAAAAQEYLLLRARPVGVRLGKRE